MSSEEYITFQRFNDPAQANELAFVLDENGLDYVLEDASANFDPSFANNPIAKEYRIKLRQMDFAKADELLTEISAVQAETISSDHYLYGFTSPELMDIVARPDEWSKLDYMLAQRILRERGKEVAPPVAEKLKKERIRQLSKTYENEGEWVLVGYLASALVPPLGVAAGWHLISHKKTLPNGDRVIAYSESDRESGKNIFILGIIMTIAYLIFLFWKMNHE